MSTIKERCIVRKARDDDCEGIISLIKELADYEKMPNGPTLDAETLRKDGFGPEKMFHCYVAEDTDINRVVGYALYFFNYSTWEGACVYLEDLYVSPEYRHCGIGTDMWRAVAKVAVDRGYKRLDWVCLNWNKASIDYYKSKGARDLTTSEGWNLFRLSGEKLASFATN